MPDTTERERLFRLAAGLCDIALAGAVVAAWLHDAHGPSLSVVGVFAAFVFVSENVGVRFPTPVAVSPQLILVTGAMAALRGRGTVLGVMLVGACGGLLVDALRSRRGVVVAFNIGQMGLSAGAAAGCYALLRHPHASAAGTLLQYLFTCGSYLVVNVVLTVPIAAVKAGIPLGDVWADVRFSSCCDLAFGLVGLAVGNLYLSRGYVALVVLVGVAVVARIVHVSFLRLRLASSRLPPR